MMKMTTFEMMHSFLLKYLLYELEDNNIQSYSLGILKSHIRYVNDSKNDVVMWEQMSVKIEHQ